MGQRLPTQRRNYVIETMNPDGGPAPGAWLRKTGRFVTPEAAWGTLSGHLVTIRRLQGCENMEGRVVNVVTGKIAPLRASPVPPSPGTLAKLPQDLLTARGRAFAHVMGLAEGKVSDRIESHYDIDMTPQLEQVLTDIALELIDDGKLLLLLAEVHRGRNDTEDKQG